MALNKNNRLEINLGAKSSRFVIDLKKSLTQETANQPPARKNFESKLEKLAEIDYAKLIRNWSESAKKRLSARPRANKKNKSLIDQLAFACLAKALCAIFSKIFIVFRKICYFAGYSAIFVLRFAYFSILKVLTVVLPFFGKITSLFFKFQNNLPRFYSACVEKISYFARIRAAGAKNNATSAHRQAGNRGLLKPVLVFAAVLFAIILPAKFFDYYHVVSAARGKILGASESAVNNLAAAGQSAAHFDFNLAGRDFESAADNFLKAQNALEEINGMILALASIAPDENIRLAAEAKHILEAGKSSADAGKNLSMALESVFNSQNRCLNDILKNLNFYGNNAINNLQKSAEELNKIGDAAIPENFREKFILLKQKINELSAGLKEFMKLADSLENFIGTSADKRYLLVFQNNAELRASGGFIGSFALVDFSKGKIKNIEVPAGGSYDTDAGLLEKIKSPEPLTLVRPDWHFWDANWWPDWPSSARKLAWFYENSDGATVDGVIGFTPDVVEKLLKIIGPINMQNEYGLTIDSDNFWFETQKLAEQKPDAAKKPKKIIGDLMNKIIEQLPQKLNKKNFAALLKAMEESLSDKNIMLYFMDKNMQDKMDDFGWSGRMKNTGGDYLSVINTNIAGGKSDRKIKQRIMLKAEAQSDGSIIDDVTIIRVHEGVKREPFIGVRNVNWMRIYVPLGSEFIEASGFKPVDKIFFKKIPEGLQNDPEISAAENSAEIHEASGTKIYNESGKTVFANWSQLDPGETVEIKIRYKLPFKITDKMRDSAGELADWLVEKASAILNSDQKNLYSYFLLAQKQPGMNSSSFSGSFEAGADFKKIWQYPGEWQAEKNFSADKIIAAIYEK